MLLFVCHGKYTGLNGTIFLDEKMIEQTLRTGTNVGQISHQIIIASDIAFQCLICDVIKQNESEVGIDMLLVSDYIYISNIS